MNRIQIQRVVDYFGNDAEAARKIGVSKTAVKLWKDGKNRITGERAIQFEELTQGHVMRQDFRPDLFGYPEKKSKPLVYALDANSLF